MVISRLRASCYWVCDMKQEGRISQSWLGITPAKWNLEKFNMDNSTATRRMEPTIPAIMFIFGVISNLIAIVVLCKSRREQKETTFYTLVCGLAVTDLLGTVLASPVTIATYVKGAWPDGDPLCQYFGFVLLFFSLAGLSIICAMSIERYIAINHAYFYNDYVDKKLAGVTLLAIYASNILFCALPSAGFGEVKMQYPQTWCFIDWRTNVSTHRRVFVHVRGDAARCWSWWRWCVTCWCAPRSCGCTGASSGARRSALTRAERLIPAGAAALAAWLARRSRWWFCSSPPPPSCLFAPFRSS